MGFTVPFLNYKHLKLKLRVLLAGHTVAMVSYCVTKMTTTCSPIIGQFFDITIVASTDKSVVIIIAHQNLRKCWKLFCSASTCHLSSHILQKLQPCFCVTRNYATLDSNFPVLVAMKFPSNQVTNEGAFNFR